VLYFSKIKFTSKRFFLDLELILLFYFSKKKIFSLQTVYFIDEKSNINFFNLKKNYENCSFVSFDNCAISVNNEITHLYKVSSKYIKNYSNHIPGITSFDKKHLLKHGVKSHHIISENVTSINMENLISKHNLKSFDLLFIDAEGYDGKIVIDFLTSTLIKPIIILEFIHIKNDVFKNLINNLEQKKYIFFSLDENLVCYPENDKKYIKFN